MSDPQAQAPTRLLDDPALSSTLRSDLQLASAHAPLTYDLDAGLARFEQTLSAKPATSSAGSNTAGAGLRVVGWLIGAAVLISGGVGASMLSQAWSRDRPAWRICVNSVYRSMIVFLVIAIVPSHGIPNLFFLALTSSVTSIKPHRDQHAL